MPNAMTINVIVDARSSVPGRLRKKKALREMRCRRQFQHARARAIPGHDAGGRIVHGGPVGLVAQKPLDLVEVRADEWPIEVDEPARQTGLSLTARGAEHARGRCRASDRSSVRRFRRHPPALDG
jgi:hypothetical protein